MVAELDKNYINNKLDDLQHQLNKKYTKLLEKQNTAISNDILIDFCDQFFQKTKDQEGNTAIELLPFYDWFIENYSVKPLISSSKPLQKGTAKTYRNAYCIIKRFNDTVYRVRYDKINYKFYNDYLNWLYEQGYSTNYIGTQIKILKTILIASHELGYHTNTECRKKYFKKPTEVIDHIFLNTEELKRIKKLDLSDFKNIKTKTGVFLTKDKMDRARDLFLISANTGLRVSDFNKLEKDNIITVDNKKYFQLTTKKNNKPIIIPINSTVIEILNKRNGELPNKMPEQHINYALKIIGEKSGIDTLVKITRTTGGIKETEEYKKHQLITNHTGRRSFCTNAYLSGMPAIDIMAISGHSSERVFYNYIKANNLQRAMKISENKFFS
ncbi:tyrosine-type recombinase/integrase [Maribacter luteus]|nr:tyrosine-type recombinase/integrase [Maribacter luteus]